ncbi:hypothetical protein RND59_05450 [Vibrio ruber]|uniref:hypothetical protein n=1 Tax=Vibrio ruber TaxID=184755 RepID=UPI0028936CCF|nr:hypothetical protein [Vibrio ruber]WNJ96541.1 hypothetical protein RND59_05450 [Vibrio ruber]
MKPELNTQFGTLAICQSVVETLKPIFEGTDKELDKVGSVARYHKRFNTAADVKQNVTRRGCIQIAGLNVINVQRSAGYTIGTIQFAAFVITDDHYGKNRAERAELIAGRLGMTVVSPDFSRKLGDVAHSQVEQARWQSLTNQAFDDIGVAIWAVEWQQECRLNTPSDTASMDDFITCDMTMLQSDGGPQLRATIELEQ